MYAREINNIGEAVSALNTNPTQARLYQIRDLIRATRLSLVRSQPSDRRLIKAIELLSLAEAQMSSRVNPAVDFFKTAAQAPISPFTSTPRGPWGLQSLESIEAGPPQPLQTQARQQFTDVQNLLIQAKSLILSADTPPILRSNPKSLGYCNTEQMSDGVDIGYQEGEPLVNLMCEGFLPEAFYSVGVLRPESFMDALQLFYPDPEIISQFQPVHLVSGGRGSDGLSDKPKIPKEKPPAGKYAAVYGDIKMFTGWFFIFEALVLGKDLKFKKTGQIKLDPDFSSSYTLFGHLAAAGATYAITGDPVATGTVLAPAAGVFFDDPIAKSLAESGVRAGAAQYDKYQKRQENKKKELASAQNQKAKPTTTNSYRVNGYTPTQIGNCESAPHLGWIDRLVAGGVAVGAVGAIAFTNYVLDNPAYSSTKSFLKENSDERGIELGFKFVKGHTQWVYWSEVMRLLEPMFKANNEDLKALLQNPPVEHLVEISRMYGDLGFIDEDNIRAFQSKQIPNSPLFYIFDNLEKSILWLFKNLNTYKFQDLVVRGVGFDAESSKDVAFFETSIWDEQFNLAHGNGYCGSIDAYNSAITENGKAPECDSFFGCLTVGINTVVSVVNFTKWDDQWNSINCGEGFEVYDPEHRYSNAGVAHFKTIYGISNAVSDNPFTLPLDRQDTVRAPNGSYISKTALSDIGRIPLGMAQALMAVFLIYGVQPEVLERFRALGATWVEGMCRWMDPYYASPEFLAKKEAAFKEAQAYLDKRPPQFVNLPMIKPKDMGSKFGAALVLGLAGYATYKLSQKKK